MDIEAPVANDESSQTEARILGEEPPPVEEVGASDWPAAFAACSQAATPEEKLKMVLAFMQEALTGGETPRFRDFWMARQQALIFFKESMQPPVRAQFWERYIALSEESRKIKEVLDEQAAFAVEQITIAIQGLETDLGSQEAQLQRIPAIEVPEACDTLRAHTEHYQKLQKELHLLNTFAARVNALRKELIKTNMRVSQKNKFFRQLSEAGDKIFPRRKDLIKEMGELFSGDVAAFEKAHFRDEQIQGALFRLREEIKGMQSFAKALTLSAQVFTDSRNRLSRCWELVKSGEKELRKERNEKKALYKELETQLRTQLQELASQITPDAPEKLAFSEGKRRLDDLWNTVGKADLGRDERNALRDEINALRRTVSEALGQQEEQRRGKERAASETRRHKIEAWKARLEGIKERASTLAAEQLSQERERILTESAALPLSQADKQMMEIALRAIDDTLDEKKQQALLRPIGDAAQSLEPLEEVLRQRKERRQEIKTQLETYRKASGGSSLDFEKAMMYQELVAQEKERLEKVQAGIAEIEAEIAKLTG